jgi:hypothetical protein
MKRFPALIWPLMSLALPLILMGLSHWQWEEIVLGTLGALGVFGAAAYLSTRGHDQEGRPRPPRMGLAMGGIAAFLGDTTEHSHAERVAQPDGRFERQGQNTRR